jgi:hypothetical protein
MLILLHQSSTSIEFLVATDKLMYCTLRRWNTTGRSVWRTDLYLTTHNTDKVHPCTRQYSNPHPQQSSGRRPRGHSDRFYISIPVIIYCRCTRPVFQIPTSYRVKITISLCLFPVRSVISQKYYIPFNMLRYFRGI